MRRNLDFYPTPAFATRELLKHVRISGSVLECCAGDGAIAKVLSEAGLTVLRNDIDRKMPNLDFNFDATKDHGGNWKLHDWVVTNPPFNVAPLILPVAYDWSRIGMAMLLRLSYLEPVKNRGAWLNSHPPTTLIVLPRISFTGDGRCDSVCTAWFVWNKEAERAKNHQIIIAKNPRFVESKN